MFLDVPALPDVAVFDVRYHEIRKRDHGAIGMVPDSRPERAGIKGGDEFGDLVEKLAVEIA